MDKHFLGTIGGGVLTHGMSFVWSGLEFNQWLVDFLLSSWDENYDMIIFLQIKELVFLGCEKENELKNINISAKYKN